MRLVVDTNVFVSAALKSSSWPAHTLRWVAQNATLLKTAEIEWEVLTVLQRPRIASKLTPFIIGQIGDLLAAADMITITETIIACRDPDDDKFLELAVNGSANALISGDDDLLSLGSFRDIPIIPPAVFGRAMLL